MIYTPSSFVTRKTENEKKINRLARSCKRLEIGLVATNDVHFLYPQDFFVHRVFTAIREQSHIHTKLDLTSEDCWLKTDRDMEYLFLPIFRKQFKIQITLLKNAI